MKFNWKIEKHNEFSISRFSTKFKRICIRNQATPSNTLYTVTIERFLL